MARLLSRPARPAASLSLLAVACLAAACGESSSGAAAPPAADPETTASQTTPHRVDEEVEPVVPGLSVPVVELDLANSYLDPGTGALVGDPTGTATVTFDLVQGQGPSVDLRVELSLDGGATWQPATVDADLTGLGVPPGGGAKVTTTFEVTWYLAEDLEPGTYGDEQAVLGAPAIELRVAFVGGEAEAAAAEPIAVDLLGFPFPGDVPLATARRRHAGFVVDGGTLVVVGGGGPFGATLSGSEAGQLVGHLFEPESENPAALSLGREDLAQVRLPDGRLLLAGGRGVAGPGTAVDLFDPATGLFSPAAPLQRARAGATGLLLPNGLAVVLAGDADGDSYELYDPVADAWTLGSLGQAYQDVLALGLSDGRILVTGAAPGTDTPRSEFLVLTGDLTLGPAPAPIPTTVRRGGTATALLDGRVLFLGGRLATGALAAPTAQLLDPDKGTWVALPTDNPDVPGYRLEARWGHAVHLTGSGLLQVTGGRTADLGGHLARTDRFDPAAGRFEPDSPLPQALAHHRLDRLAGGSLVATGGQGQSGDPVPDTATLLPPDGPDSLPTATVLDLTYQPPLGQVVVDYALADAESHPARVRLEWTTRPQEPNSWRAMTQKFLLPGFPLGDGYHELETSPEGTAHNFAWNVVADDIFALGSPQDVHVRVTPIGATEGVTVEFSEQLP